MSTVNTTMQHSATSQTTHNRGNRKHQVMQEKKTFFLIKWM